MDLELLKERLLNEASRGNGFNNWNYMKMCIKESEARFIEKVIMMAFRKIIILTKEQSNLSDY